MFFVDTKCIQFFSLKHLKLGRARLFDVQLRRVWVARFRTLQVEARWRQRRRRRALRLLVSLVLVVPMTVLVLVLALLLLLLALVVSVLRRAAALALAQGAARWRHLLVLRRGSALAVARGATRWRHRRAAGLAAGAGGGGGGREHGDVERRRGRLGRRVVCGQTRRALQAPVIPAAPQYGPAIFRTRNTSIPVQTLAFRLAIRLKVRNFILVG